MTHSQRDGAHQPAPDDGSTTNNGVAKWVGLARSSALGKQAFWSLASSLIARAAGLATTVVIGRTLGREGLGVFALIFNTMVTFQVFAGVGLSVTATRFVAEFRQADKPRAGTFLLFVAFVATGAAAVFAAALFIAAPLLATSLLGQPETAGLLRVACIALFFGALSSAANGALAGLEAFSTIARLNSASGIISLLSAIAGTYFLGLEGAIWSISLSSLVTYALTRRALRRELAFASIPVFPAVRYRPEWAVLWKFALPALLSAALVAPVMWLCTAQLARRADGLAEVGAFNAANQWFNLLVLVPGAVGQALLPALSRRSRDEGPGKRRLVLQSVWVTSAAAALLTMLGSIVSPAVMSLYGPGFSSEWPVLVVVFATSAFFAMQVPVSVALTARNEMWIGFLMNLGWAVSMVAFSAGLLSLGALGLALARLGAYALHFLWCIGYYLRVERSPPAPAKTSP